MPKSNFNTINSLALFGGKKSITFRKPHWLWPVNSKNKIKVISNYFQNEHKSRSGYPLEVKKFEHFIKKFTKVKYAVAVNSGTSALHLSCLGLGLNKNECQTITSRTTIC